MSNNIIPFNFGQSTIRTTTIGNAVWFVAHDVCQALGYANSRSAVADHLDDDERSTVANADSRNGGGKLTIINESGLYALVLRSRKPEARKFAKWVTGEVLPAIRKTGSYTAQEAQPTINLRKTRFLVWFDDAGNELIKPIENDAFVSTHSQLCNRIRETHGMFSVDEVVQIASACFDRMQKNVLERIAK